MEIHRLNINKEIQEIKKNVPIFKNWHYLVLKELFNSSFEMEAIKGSQIFSEKDQVNFIYLVLEGEFQLMKNMSYKDNSLSEDAEFAGLVQTIDYSRRCVPICITSKWEILGETDFAKKRSNYNLSCRCISRSAKFYKIPTKKLLSLITTKYMEDFNEVALMKDKFLKNRIKIILNKNLESKKLLGINLKDHIDVGDVVAEEVFKAQDFDLMADFEGYLSGQKMKEKEFDKRTSALPSESNLTSKESKSYPQTNPSLSLDIKPKPIQNFQYKSDLTKKQNFPKIKKNYKKNSSQIFSSFDKKSYKNDKSQYLNKTSKIDKINKKHENNNSLIFNENSAKNFKIFSNSSYNKNLAYSKNQTTHHSTKSFMRSSLSKGNFYQLDNEGSTWPEPIIFEDEGKLVKNQNLNKNLSQKATAEHFVKQEACRSKKLKKSGSKTFKSLNTDDKFFPNQNSVTELKFGFKNSKNSFSKGKAIFERYSHNPSEIRKLASMRKLKKDLKKWDTQFSKLNQLKKSQEFYNLMQKKQQALLFRKKAEQKNLEFRQLSKGQKEAYFVNKFDDRLKSLNTNNIVKALDNFNMNFYLRRRVKKKSLGN